MMSKFTHTARIAVATPVGPEQMGRVLPVGTTVEVYQDPAQQNGNLITIREGWDTGVIRVRDLRLVAPKAAK
jgi:hypothetical protein